MTKVSVRTNREYDKDELEVLERFKEFQLAMIDKDSSKLEELMNDNYTLTHMSGKKQTKQEYIDEIMNGTLNYYTSTIHNPTIEIKNNEYALIKADVTLDAKVYGMKGTWTLHSQQNFKKIDGKWYLYEWDNK
jgi:hypothetical protein